MAVSTAVPDWTRQSLMLMMSPHKVLGFFSDILALICVDDARLGSTISLSFLHDCNIPRIVTNHRGVAVESTCGPVRVPTVDGWYNSRQIRLSERM